MGYKVKFWLGCVIVILMTSFSPELHGQDTTEEQLMEKFSFGVGLGRDYSLLGIKGEYTFSDRVRLVSGYGMNGFYAGSQVHFPKFFIKKLSPFVSLTYGNFGIGELENSAGIREQRRFYGLSTGLGLYWNPISRFPNISFHFGLNYFWYKRSTDRFVQDFNEQYNSSYTGYNFRNPMPTLGIMRRFN